MKKLGGALLAAWLSTFAQLAAQTSQPAAPAFNFPDLSAGTSLQDQKKALLESIQTTIDPGPDVMNALGVIPRESFLPAYLRNLAYEDSSLPLGNGRALPSTSDLARIALALNMSPNDKLLIYGSSNGYAAAVLGRLVGQVWDVEVSPGEQQRSAPIFESLGITNVTSTTSSATTAYSAAAPFDEILVHGSVVTLPAGLYGQLRTGGRIIVPLADPSGLQMLVLIRKSSPEPLVQAIGKCFFAQLPVGGQ